MLAVFKSITEFIEIKRQDNNLLFRTRRWSEGGKRASEKIAFSTFAECFYQPTLDIHDGGYGQLVTLCNNNKQYFNYRNWIMSQLRGGWAHDVTCRNRKLALFGLVFTMCWFVNFINKYKNIFAFSSSS